jgi:hypothetical protein
VGEVRLVVPAGSGPRWRTALREAARRAGLGEPTLVDAPAAAAEHLVATTGPMVVGSFLLVCDWGNGFTASVLRRTRYGFDVLSTIDAADGGGSALDQAVAGHLAALAGSADALVEADPGWCAAARWGREALGRVPALTVQAPAGAPVLLTWDGARDSLRPVVTRAAATARAALEAADVPVEQMTGVFCVGGVAQSWAMVDLLALQSGLPVVVSADPGRSAVLGAARATGPNADAVSAAAVAEPPLPRWQRPLVAVVPGAASLLLFWHFVATGSLHRAAGIGYDPNAYLLANWGELALVGLFALVTCLASAVVIAAVLPVQDPLAVAGTPAGYGQQMGAGLLAACGVGLSVAGLFAIFGAVVMHWSNTPFLRWALLPILPIVAAVAVTAGLVARSGRMPAGGWHEWLNFPVWSVCLAAVGMAAVQVGLSTPRYPADEAILNLLGRVGAVLIAVAAVMVLVRRWRYRLILSAPLAVVAAGIVAPATTGVLAMVYVLAATAWWVRRAWQLAAHPRGSLPRPA